MDLTSYLISDIFAIFILLTNRDAVKRVIYFTYRTSTHMRVHLCGFKTLGPNNSRIYRTQGQNVE
jgi:hypothetical protein